MKIVLFAAAISCLSLSAIAQQSETAHEAKSTKIGKISVTAFNQINNRGNEMVNAITPTKTTLSSTDLRLFNQVVRGGMRQLAISQAVLNKATNEQVRMLAQSEVEEQTNLSKKLTEIAQAKGITLPTDLDAQTQTLLGRIESMSSEEIDMIYLEEGGIKGHQLLQATMLSVQRISKDATMKKLASATLPVIRTHLMISTDVRTAMSGSRRKNSQTR
jgi:putative membrane protein